MIGTGPNLAELERRGGVRVLDVTADGPLWLLLRVAATNVKPVLACFGGVTHVYETEEEARRVWQLLGLGNPTRTTLRALRQAALAQAATSQPVRG